MVTRRIKTLAHEAGFHAVGVVRAGLPLEAERRFLAWRAKGYAGEMKFLKNYESRRDQFLKETEWAKSILVLGANYFQKSLAENPPTPASGKVARYAWGADYHKAIRARHEKLIERLKQEINPEARFVSSIDTRPLFERETAQRAGLGFIGKQNQLLSLEFGPWLFLSELITDLELEENAAHVGSCGTCRVCIDACPTGAIQVPFEMDATKCIAYHTIENPGEIPAGIQSKMENWFYGCDACLTACPYTAKQKETDWPEFQRVEGEDPEWIDVNEIISLESQGAFERKFKERAIARINKKQAVRNAQVVVNNASNFQSR
ncbi:MAG: tRNA epoxyqueuosine(34) reductase QueG [Candidatus Omnitrophica bacterium]|nr:tRNA epoxyqueuosine(34) reductase QueG [Candidatus Omnitrophota bacterium]